MGNSANIGTSQTSPSEPQQFMRNAVDDEQANAQQQSLELHGNHVEAVDHDKTKTNNFPENLEGNQGGQLEGGKNWSQNVNWYQEESGDDFSTHAEQSQEEKLELNEGGYDVQDEQIHGKEPGPDDHIQLDRTTKEIDNGNQIKMSENKNKSMKNERDQATSVHINTILDMEQKIQNLKDEVGILQKQMQEDNQAKEKTKKKLKQLKTKMKNQADNWEQNKAKIIEDNKLQIQQLHNKIQLLAESLGKEKIKRNEVQEGRLKEQLADKEEIQKLNGQMDLLSKWVASENNWKVKVEDEVRELKKHLVEKEEKVSHLEEEVVKEDTRQICHICKAFGQTGGKHKYSRSGFPEPDSCPHIIERSIEEKDHFLKQYNICRRCTKEAKNHDERTCQYLKGKEYLQCSQYKCGNRYSFCHHHQSENINLLNRRKEVLQKCGLEIFY